MSRLYHNGEWVVDPWLHFESIDELIDQLQSGADHRFLKPATLPLDQVGRALAIAPLPAPKIGARVAADTTLGEIAPFFPLLGSIFLST